MRTCTNCGKGPPAVHFVSCSGNWCESCMETLRAGAKKNPEARKRNMLTKVHHSNAAKKWNRMNAGRTAVYRQRFLERKAGVPEDQLTPLPSPFGY